MHVLCAPPAFILSQDQTLLFLVSIFCLSTYINLIHKCLNLTLFLVDYSTAFYWSFSKIYCLLFNVLSCSLFVWNEIYFTICFCFCQHFFKTFLFYFFVFPSPPKGHKKISNFSSCFTYFSIENILLISLFYLFFFWFTWYIYILPFLFISVNTFFDFFLKCEIKS